MRDEKIGKLNIYKGEKITKFILNNEKIVFDIEFDKKEEYSKITENDILL
jgi:hypothetical protein